MTNVIKKVDSIFAEQETAIKNGEDYKAFWERKGEEGVLDELRNSVFEVGHFSRDYKVALEYEFVTTYRFNLVAVEKIVRQYNRPTLWHKAVYDVDVKEVNGIGIPTGPEWTYYTHSTVNNDEDVKASLNEFFRNGTQVPEYVAHLLVRLEDGQFYPLYKIITGYRDVVEPITPEQTKFLRAQLRNWAIQ